MTNKDKEEYYLYFYRKSLGNKHTGKMFFDDTEAMFIKVKDGINCKDISEIRVTDLADDMVIHWNEEEGVLFPVELKGVDDFKPKKLSKRTLVIPVERRKITMENIFSAEIIAHNELLREKRGR